MSAHPTDSTRTLDLAADAAWLAENAQRYAQPKAVAHRGVRSAIVFRVGGEWLGLATGAFREIAPVRPVHTVPHRRDTVLTGLVNVRGVLVPCVSLARALGLRGGEAGAATARLAVVGRDGEPLAFIADEISAVLRFDDADVRPVPTTLAHAQGIQTRGMLPWGQTPVGLLDESRFLPHLNALLR